MLTVRPTKKIFRRLLCALIGGAGALAARAVPPPAGVAVSVSATASTVSQYVFRGERRGGPSFQPYVQLNCGGFAASVWSNFPLADKVPGQSDPELDFAASCAFEIAPDLASLVPGFTVYTYPQAPTTGGFHRATFEPSLALNYTLARVRFTPTCYYDLTRRGPIYELTAATALPLVHLGTELDFSGTLGTFDYRDAVNHATGRVRQRGDYWLVGVALPCALPHDTTLSLGWAYTKGSGNYFQPDGGTKKVNAAAVGRGVVTLSYAIRF